MAGRTPEPGLPPDPILAARLEAIRALADHHTDRVMVVGADHTVVYANQSAWPTASLTRASGEPTKCYGAMLNRTTPCDSCPATEVFTSGAVTSLSCASESPSDAHACGIAQAFPLKGSAGDTDSVLVLFRGQGADGLRSAGTLPALPAVPFVRDADGDATTDKPLGLEGMLGQSEPMRRLFETIQIVADSQATVLIQGESGTGKELVARTLHRLSPRRDRPMVVVECSSLPETLLESELFGHVKGAFTGAATNRRGLFEEADGGTIFLDEIADTTPTFQAKLLRVLQEGECKPLGSNRAVKVDVRVISASNKDLFELVKAKAFREDLYYRLAVLPLFLPPLRERREDIPLLVGHFVGEASRRHRRPLRPVTADAMQQLGASLWPGNVRELYNLVERVVVTTKGDSLTVGDFFGGAAPEPTGSDLRAVVRGVTTQAERSSILEALQNAGGNRLRAAKLLGISRASLYNKLRAYRIT